ncbi:MAG: ABC transporter substrate-binding protein [Schwartzia sp.]|nr:ABC transporter substrate-binding protein [Schwartzia sp. (in: firmicutes)]
MKTTWRIFATILCALMLAAAIGCGGGNASTEKKPESAAKTESFATLKDDLGREVTLAKKPERIVVTSASFLEPLHTVGGDVVGRPDSKSVPDWAKDKTSIGRVYNVDLEKLLACAPDLVIANKGMNEKLLQTLEINNIPCLVVDMKNYEEVKNEVRIFSQVTGEKEKGETLIKNMDDKIKAIADRLPKEKRRVAILHSTAQGLSVQLDTSIAGSTAKMLGFENVASGMTALEGNPDAAPYSIETLVEQNPEIIFVTSMGKLDEIKRGMEETIASNPAWQTIPAVKNGKMYYLSQEHFLLSPGIHYPDAVEEMAKLIYPDLFK